MQFYNYGNFNLNYAKLQRTYKSFLFEDFNEMLRIFKL